MISYKGFQNNLDEAIKWGFLKKAFDWIKARLLSFIKKLGFGQTVRIPLSSPNMIMESLMCKVISEAKMKCGGGPVQPILGNYGEWCTAVHIFKLMDKINKKRHTFNFDRNQAKQILKEKQRREKEIKEMATKSKNPKWDGMISYTNDKGVKVTENVKERYPHCWESYMLSISSSWMDYDQKTELGAEGIISILVDNMEDMEIAKFDINMTGQGGGKGDEGTADLIISKMDKDKVIKEMKFSLKTSMGGIDATKGTTILGWFQALCDVGDIKVPAGSSMKLWMDPDVLSQLSKKFGDEMADFVKMMSDLDREIFHAIPNHKMTAFVPEEDWEDPKALTDIYMKKQKREAQLYGLDGMPFKTVNQAIEQYPDVFIRPAHYNKKGELKRAEQIESNPNFRKDYITKVYGIGLNSMGSQGWARITEKLSKDPVTKRKLVNWVMERMEVTKDAPFFVSTGTEKTNTSKSHVLDVHRPSKDLVENWNNIIDSIDFRVKVNFKEVDKFKGFKPSKVHASHLLDKHLDEVTPKDYGSFFWELEIPGVKTFSWRWEMSAHGTGTAQLSVPAEGKQTMIDISGELTEKIAKKFGIDIHLN